MIVLSNSVPKSGSTLIANFQEDFLKLSGIKSGQEKLVTEYSGRFIERHTNKVLWNLSKINLFHGTVVVKCHWDVDKILNLFCNVYDVKMTMAYRDPRDIILSMIDSDKRKNESAVNLKKLSLKGVEDLLPRLNRMMKNFMRWRSKKYVHCIRYENLINDRRNVLKNMLIFLNWKIKESELDEVILFREETKFTSWNFNKGTTERWKNEMNDSEKGACRKALGQYLKELNYEC